MFDDKAVAHYLKVPSPSTNSEEANEAIRNAKRISLSGAQPKYSVIVDEQESYLRYTQEGEQGTYIKAVSQQLPYTEPELLRGQ